MPASLNVDTDGVRDAAAATAAAPASSATPAVAVTPCAADAVSVQMATRLSGAATALNAGTIGVHARAAAAGEHLAATAQSYDAQDISASRVLARGVAGGGGVVPVAAMAIPVHPAAPAPPGVPAGTEPVTGVQASALIHGGPGADGFDTAATILAHHAADLERSADQVRAARNTSESSWASSAADTVQSHLHRLEADYVAQAESARRLAGQFRAHADDYRRTKAAIPTPQTFDTLTQRLKMAVAANNTPPTVGLYGPSIAALQGQLAEANHTAMAAYQQYRTAAVGSLIPVVSGNGQGSAADGSDSADQGPAEELSAAAAADAAAGGELPGTDTLSSGADPAAAALGGDPGSELLSTVVPALLGGVTGLVGGLVSGLAAAGQGVQQAGTQLVGGLTQAATSAANAAAAKANLPDLAADFGGDPGSPELGGAGDFGGGGGDFPGAGDFGGGGDYGGTSPASLAGGAPGTFPAAAPVTAAPATFSAGGASAPAAAASAGGPGMMPPMMPMGMGGAAAGADADRRLYPERRLRVESPANAEPVKGRREARKTRAKSGEENREGTQ